MTSRYTLPPLPPNVPTNRTRCLPGKSVPCVADKCLSGNANAFTKYVKSGEVWRKAYPKYAGSIQPPWITMPFDAIRLNQNGNMALSALTPGALTPVVTYTVPSGYDGIIDQILQIFVPQGGTAFQDGSTALTWYIGVNQAFVSFYVSMNYHEGSLDSLGRVTHGAGIRIFSNQIYTYYVKWDGTPLDPSGQILCGLNGWIYPVH